MDGGSAKSSMSDKRRHERFEERNRVAVTVLSAPEAPHIEHRTFYCWTHDLSESGLKFCVHSPVPIGALLDLEITFKDPVVRFRHLGRVMWEQEFEEDHVISNWLGVRFTETVGGDDAAAKWAAMIIGKLRSPAGSG